MMLFEIDDYWKKELLKSAKLLNGGKKYDTLKDFIEYGDKTYIKVDDLLGWIENLNYELEETQEMLIDMTNDVESNYKHISHWEQSGMNYRDFI